MKISNGNETQKVFFEFRGRFIAFNQTKLTLRQLRSAGASELLTRFSLRQDAFACVLDTAK
jgi:hypothetical protein